MYPICHKMANFSMKGFDCVALQSLFNLAIFKERGKIWLILDMRKAYLKLFNKLVTMQNLTVDVSHLFYTMRPFKFDF